MTWQRAALLDVSVLGPQYGANVRAVQSSGGTVRYIRITDIDEWGRLRKKSWAEPESENVNDYLLEDGDILLARSGATVGKSYVYSTDDGPCVFAGYLIRFRLDRRVAEPRYLAYYLQTREYWSWIKAKRRVAAQPNVNGAEYASLPLPIPPLSEQRRIVEILDQADRLRRLRAEADAKTQQILPIILTKILGAQSTWETDLRARPLGDVAEFVSGGTPSKLEGRYWNGEVPWVSPKDMKDDLLYDTQDHLSADAVEQSNLKLVDSDAVLIVVRGMILARTVPIVLTRSRVTINQDLKAILPRCDEVSGPYLWAAMSLARRHLQTKVRTAGHGTRKLNTPDLLQLPILVPSPQQLATVESIVKTHETLTRGRRTVRERVDRMFALLLNQAFSGHLTLEWREAHLKELLEEMEQQAKTLAEIR